jgi:GNAT superfamily N-acetyltransferase
MAGQAAEPLARWRRARLADGPAIQAYLIGRESHAAGIAGRIRRDSGLPGLPVRPGGIFLSGSPRIESLCLFTAGATVFPLAAEPVSCASFGGLRLSRTIRAFKPSSCVGLDLQVSAVEEALSWSPAIRNHYRIMSLERDAYRPRACPGGECQPSRATLDDLDELSVLAGLYDREEVLTALHRYDAAASKAGQLRSIRTQVVYLVRWKGRVVGRAQTNARAWTKDQLGGIYVLPDFRGLGIGRAVVQALIEDRLAEGRGLCLFVKETNEPALGLYRSLGFKDEGSYRVDYFA